jgi:hypothetical protein
MPDSAMNFSIASGLGMTMLSAVSLWVRACSEGLFSEGG